MFPLNRTLIWPVILVVVFAISRIPGLMPWNFSAVYAFAFCAGVFFKGRLPWWVPLAVILGTDLALNCYYQYKSPDSHVWSGANLANLSFNYIAYITIIFLGRRFKPQSSLISLIGGGVLGAILFYLITNTASWLFNPFNNPEYAKTLTGLIIALTRGVGGYPETWEFFRNTLMSAGLFTALFAAGEKASAESPADKKAGLTEAAPEGETQPETQPEEAKA